MKKLTNGKNYKQLEKSCGKFMILPKTTKNL